MLSLSSLPFRRRRRDAAHRADLVDEDHRRCALAARSNRSRTRLARPRRTSPRTPRPRRRRTEPSPGGGGAGQRGLPGPGAPFEQHPAGLAPRRSKLLWIRQEVDDFRHLDDRLVETAQALEPEVGDVRRPGGASRDRHPARTGPGDDEPGDEGEQRQRHQGGGDVGRRRLRRLHPEVRGVDPQLSQERLLGGLEVPVAVGEGALFVVAGPPHRPGVGADVHSSTAPLDRAAMNSVSVNITVRSSRRRRRLPRRPRSRRRRPEPGAAQERHEATERTHPWRSSPSGTVCRRRWWWTCWELGLLEDGGRTRPMSALHRRGPRGPERTSRTKESRLPRSPSRRADLSESTPPGNSHKTGRPGGHGRVPTSVPCSTSRRRRCGRFPVWAPQWRSATTR